MSRPEDDALRLFCISLLALAFSMCGHGNYLPEPPAPGAPNTRVIEHVREYTARDWQRTPWYRTEDMVLSGPVFVVVTRDGHACLVEGPVWAVAQRGDRIQCATHWRFPRP